MGEHANTARQIPLDGHLLTIQEGNPIPAAALTGLCGGKAGIEISGDREGHRDDSLMCEFIASDQGIHEFPY